MLRQKMLPVSLQHVLPQVICIKQCRLFFLLPVFQQLSWINFDKIPEFWPLSMEKRELSAKEFYTIAFEITEFQSTCFFEYLDILYFDQIRLRHEHNITILCLFVCQNFNFLPRLPSLLSANNCEIIEIEKL